MIDCPASGTMRDLSPGGTTVPLSELRGNKKQLSKCHSVTSTIEGCRVVGRGDESPAWHAGRKLLRSLPVYLTHSPGWRARGGGETRRGIGQCLCWWAILSLLYLYVILHTSIFVSNLRWEKVRQVKTLAQPLAAGGCFLPAALLFSVQLETVAFPRRLSYPWCNPITFFEKIVS